MIFRPLCVCGGVVLFILLLFFLTVQILQENLSPACTKARAHEAVLRKTAHRQKNVQELKVEPSNEL